MSKNLKQPSIWISLIIFIGSVCAWILLDCSTYNFSLTDKYMSFGALMSGIGTLGLFLAAIIKIPSELKKWKHREVIKKKMDIASQLLESFDKLIHAIKFLTSPLSFTNEIDSSKETEVDFDFFTELSRSRMKIIDEDLKLFFENKRLARIYLNKNISDKLKEIGEIWSELRVNMTIYATRPKDEKRQHDSISKSFNKFYDIDKSRENKLNDLQKDLEAIIKKEYLELET